MFGIGVGNFVGFLKADFKYAGANWNFWLREVFGHLVYHLIFLNLIPVNIWVGLNPVC